MYVCSARIGGNLQSGVRLGVRYKAQWALRVHIFAPTQKWAPVLPTLQFTRRIGLFWNPLPQVKKLLGGWPKIGLLSILLPAAALFSSNLSVSCQFREFLSPFNVQEHSIHQFQGLRVLKTSWRAINIDYPLHAEVNCLIDIPPNWVILSFSLLKNTQIWEIGRIVSW